MSSPPGSGSVIRYAYLWSHQQDADITGPEKDRPCAIVLTRRLVDGRDLVYVLPVTSRTPDEPEQAVPVPSPVRRRLGMQQEACWIVVTELNRFIWPGPDVRPVDRPVGHFCCFGALPAELFRRVQTALKVRLVRSGIRVITRDQ